MKKSTLCYFSWRVILVEHSWESFVISESGNDPRVKALVYAAAFVPDHGETLVTLIAKATPTQLSTSLQLVDGFLTLTREGVRKVFVGDLPEKEQDLVYSVKKPASPNVFNAVANDPAWKQKNFWYTISTEDETINLESEHIMTKRAHAKTAEIKASHLPMVYKPQEVLNVIF